jgi:hypothetical protein
VWESHLQTRLGTTRDELRQIREQHLQQGVDWRFKKNRVEISEAGAKKIAAHFNVAPVAVEAVQTAGAPVEAAGLKNAQPMAQGEPQEVVVLVWRTFPKNKHIIEGYLDGTDPQARKNIVRVKVKDASRFTRFDNTGKPLAIACRHLQADFYEHTGPQPKRKGRM